MIHSLLFIHFKDSALDLVILHVLWGAFFFGNLSTGVFAGELWTLMSMLGSCFTVHLGLLALFFGFLFLLMVLCLRVCSWLEHDEAMKPLGYEWYFTYK
jgi:hypothetical protein